MALLRVRTGPECPEGNLRALTRASNLNCGIARERARERERESERARARERERERESESARESEN